MNRCMVLSLAAGLWAAALGTLSGQEKNVSVVMDTSLGKVTLELFADKAPVTVKNFLQYVDDKHYDGTIFHRVIPDFMIQGGGLEPGLKEKRTRAPIKNESSNGLSNARGTIAMARIGDVADSATSQFFINVKDNTFLDKGKGGDGFGYAIFAKVTDGMDVVDKIRRVETGNKDVPVQDVVIRSVRRK
jgi:cyclophilin family peptidyl-prolyl cis-trans isomerase